MEMATNSILAAYCWAKRWPHIAKMLEVIDDPNVEDTGKVFESQNSRWYLFHVSVAYVRTTIPSSLCCTSNKCIRAAGRLKAVIQGALPHLGSGTLRPRLPDERDKDYERNTSAALLLKTRQACLNPFDDKVRACIG